MEFSKKKFNPAVCALCFLAAYQLAITKSHLGREYADWRDATSRCWERQQKVSQQIAVCSSYMVQVVWPLSWCTRFPTPIFYGGAEYLFYIRSSTLDEDCPEWLGQKKRKLWVSTKYIYMLDSPSVRVHIYFQCDGKEISWRHLEDLYRRNRGETGLVLVLKLNYEHVRLTSFSKMRVDLATQVSTLLYKLTFH